MTIAKLEAADGAFATRLAGVDVVFRMSSALWLPGERILVVADLHLDKDPPTPRAGSSFPTMRARP
ncbi:hypothetical protein NI454_15060 [Brevundimonas diminuta]|nr:hypothetical protein [Brevundimonas naejangsanensis]MCO8031271.1 hypothetical protein [Brevundimonas diminuta]